MLKCFSINSFYLHVCNLPIESFILINLDKRSRFWIKWHFCFSAINLRINHFTNYQIGYLYLPGTVQYSQFLENMLTGNLLTHQIVIKLSYSDRGSKTLITKNAALISFFSLRNSIPEQVRWDLVRPMVLVLGSDHRTINESKWNFLIWYSASIWIDVISRGIRLTYRKERYK